MFSIQLKRNFIKTKYLRHLGLKFGQDELLTRAASLAYSTTAAIAPILLLLVSFLNFLNLNMQERLLLEINNLMGGKASTLLQTTILSAKESADIAVATRWFGFILLIFSASLIFSSLQSSLNIIFDSADSKSTQTGYYTHIRSFVGKRLLSFGMVIIFIMVSAISLIGAAIISKAFSADFQWLSELVQLISGFCVYGLLFALTFKLLPDKNVKTKHAFLGGLITSSLFIVGKFLMKLYFTKIALESAYGAAGSMMALIIWIYYSSVIVLVGAEITAALHLRRLNKMSGAERA